jgi:hypothetical protein
MTTVIKLNPLRPHIALFFLSTVACSLDKQIADEPILCLQFL